jgi:hypothetical protein
MLTYAERVVAFFDEIDELVRTRSKDTEEASSRFLTTSMLPRLHRLRESRRVVFLVATNHLEDFDVAISRPGRFDLVLPVMPPTADAKLQAWPEVAGALKRYDLDGAADQLGQIEGLTYDEFASVSDSLINAPEKHEFIERLSLASKRGTLNQPVIGNTTWAELIRRQRDKIRD